MPWFWINLFSKPRQCCILKKKILKEKKGIWCKFLHPKPCPKLMNHGTWASGGCANGKNCTDFHPKMCAMSLTKGECFDPSCELKHVKGTCRKKDDYSDTRDECKDGRNNSISNNNDSLC